MAFKSFKATITDMQHDMNNGDLSAKELTVFYLKRIALHHGDINAVQEINPEALHIAEALDNERKRNGIRGPLHGIPILVKDNIETGDGMHTTAGSLALENHYAQNDALVVKKLREAGAVLIGKTNLTEWANFMTDGMPNGYSSLGGQVMNPYGPGEFDVGGSSAGSGAGVAANFASGALGTETSGSILSPASRNSIVGIKPTVGLLSRTGVIPIANSQDTAGPMARTVEDAAIMLNTLTGIDEKDPATSKIVGHTSDYTQALNENGIKKARIGVSHDYLKGLDEEEIAIIHKALADMEDVDAEIIHYVELPVNLNGSNVLFHEFKNSINSFLTDLPANALVHSLEDVIHFNKQRTWEALKYGQTRLEHADKKSGKLTESEYIDARLNDLELSQEKGIDKALKENNLDALIFANDNGAMIAAKAGYPSITVPAGYTSVGKPVGITFTGSAFSESRLIELAYAYEQATNHRKEPKRD